MDRDKLEKSLRRKGFVMDDKKDHRYFHLVVNGKELGVYTKTSHGSKKYKTLGSPLQSKIRKQLKFDDISELKEFVDCTLTHEKHLKILKKKGFPHE